MIWPNLSFRTICGRQLRRCCRLNRQAEGRPPPPVGQAALTGIVFVLRSGLPWEMLPAEMGGGSDMSCWRRLRDWHAAGVWTALHRVLLERLQAAGPIDWRRAALDSASVPAKGGSRDGAEPHGSRKPGSKRYIVVGTPLGVLIGPANPHDSQMLAPTLDAIPPLRGGRRGRPRRRPDKLHADKGYDHRRCRPECRARGITPRIARRGSDSSQRLGRHR
jgi:transposase